MAVRKIQDINKKKHKVVERLKNRAALPDVNEKREKDIKIIDSALKALYNDGDKVTRSLQTEILQANKIKISEAEAERIWDIMVNTGLVNAVIGFGNSGKLSLTNEGYQLMSQFGSYAAFLEERAKQQQAHNNQGMVFPQFIIEPAGDDKKDEEQSGIEKTDKEKKDNKK